MKEYNEEVLIPLVKLLKYQEYCERILKKSVKDAYLMLCKKELCWYHEGLIEKSHSVVMELCMNGVIEVDIASHKLLRVNGEDVSGIEHAQMLNLSDDGERWEGDVLNNKPYGWGVLYDKDNNRVYEGFQIGSVNVCYGTRYYSDIGVIEYEGEWCEGKRWGRGIQFDRTGRTVFEGEWVNDKQSSKRVVLNEENQLLHNHIEELIVQDKNCNGREWTVLDLSFMSNLKKLVVGDECFNHVNEVRMTGLNQLESVVIGKSCFTKHRYGRPKYDPNRHFFLKNCPQLRELKIGYCSFSDYSICEIENLPSLEVIEMGKLGEGSHNFLYSSLELKSHSQILKSSLDLPSLKSLLFGDWAFAGCIRVVFESMPQINRMTNRLARTNFHSTWLHRLLFPG